MIPVSPAAAAAWLDTARPAPVVDYVYAATVIGWMDGDTLDVRVDLGFTTTRVERLRLAEVNTPEKRAPGGTTATGASWALAPAGAVVTIRTFKPRAETFGRYVAEVWTTGGAHLGAVLVARGLAQVIEL